MNSIGKEVTKTPSDLSAALSMRIRPASSSSAMLQLLSDDVAQAGAAPVSEIRKFHTQLTPVLI
jgi:hypothetical protein